MDLQLMDYRNSSKCASALCFVFHDTVASARTHSIHSFVSVREGKSLFDVHSCMF